MGLIRSLAGLGRAPRPAPSVGDAQVVWAIGDVHGRSDLLSSLLTAIRYDAQRSGGSSLIIGLGDYVDRGPDAPGVLDILIALSADEAVESRFLRGNHEATLQAFLRDPTVGPSWSEFGGRETLCAYGVDCPSPRAGTDAWEEARKAFIAALPTAHSRFLERQIDSLSIGDYFFAHAGARPGVALERQSPQDLMWIRSAFLDHSGRFDKIVVHGHTPAAEVHIDRRRIGLDTGAYATGVLTALRLEQDRREIWQTTTGAYGGAPVVRRPA